MRPVVLLLALTLSLTACSSSSTSRGDRSESSSDRIVVSELSYPVGGLSAYDLVEREYPNWLQKRGPMTIKGPPESIKVYVDNTGSPFGDPSSLRQINAIQIETIEHYTAREAQFKFGLGNVAGAILVHTKATDR